MSSVGVLQDSLHVIMGHDIGNDSHLYSCPDEDGTEVSTVNINERERQPIQSISIVIEQKFNVPEFQRVTPSSS